MCIGGFNLPRRLRITQPFVRLAPACQGLPTRTGEMEAQEDGGDGKVPCRFCNQVGKSSESMIENAQRPDYDWAGRMDIICLQCAIKRDDVPEALQAEFSRKFIKTCKRLWTTRRVKKGLKVGRTRTLEWKEIRKEVDAEHPGLKYVEKRHIIMARLQMLVANVARQIDSSGQMFKDLSCANRRTKHPNAQTCEETCKK